MNISRFWEQVQLSGQPALKNCHAYRMDGNPHMGTVLNMGTCSCCDYFTLYKLNKILLVEDGQIGRKIKDLRNKYNFRKNDDRDNFVREEIAKEHILKAYGSLLVLCRLSLLNQAGRNLIGNKRYEFWIVSTDTDQPGHALPFSHLKNFIKNRLKSVFSSSLVGDVHLLTFQDFKDKFPKTP